MRRTIYETWHIAYYLLRVYVQRLYVHSTLATQDSCDFCVCFRLILVQRSMVHSMQRKPVTFHCNCFCFQYPVECMLYRIHSVIIQMRQIVDDNCFAITFFSSLGQNSGRLLLLKVIDHHVWHVECKRHLVG